MKVLLINGSPRKEDACAEAARRAAARLEAAGIETGLFWPVKTENLLCSGCGACQGRGMCVADPRAGELLRAAGDCEALLFVVPVGLFGPGVDVRNLMERVALLNEKQDGRPLSGKCAAALPVGRRSARGDAQLDALLKKLGLPRPDGALARLLEEENA